MDEQAGTEVRVCAGSDLVDGGPGVKVPAVDGNGRTTVFFVRFNGRVYGYLNRCAHVGVELDWEGSFFTRAGDLLMCARHGATYLPDTGVCTGGPCRNGRLTPVPVQERHEAGASTVYWLAGGRIRPCPNDDAS